jgi:glycosyltransferase involved in cell wall biosynthesis
MWESIKGCTCIIPCYNEQSRILSVLKKITSLTHVDAIIVVDDWSTDDSAHMIQEYCAQHTNKAIQLISYPHNAGKSHAVYTWLQQVTTPYVLLFDADLTQIQTDEISYMIDSLYAHPRIDMGILRRISSDWYIKLFYRELLLSGQRILRTQDLHDIFASASIHKYQLEVAINAYMKQHRKTTVRYPFSADNTFKHHKRWFRYGWKRDVLMFKDIIQYQWLWSFSKQILLFKPQAITHYEQQNHRSYCKIGNK